MPITPATPDHHRSGGIIIGTHQVKANEPWETYVQLYSMLFGLKMKDLSSIRYKKKARACDSTKNNSAPIDYCNTRISTGCCAKLQLRQSSWKFPDSPPDLTASRCPTLTQQPMVGGDGLALFVTL